MIDETKPEHPPGDYCIVELFGHTTLVGRYAEVERFGTKMLTGIREAFELVKRAQQIDPEAWNGLDDPASVNRRREAIWKAKQ